MLAYPPRGWRLQHEKGSCSRRRSLRGQKPVQGNGELFLDGCHLMTSLSFTVGIKGTCGRKAANVEVSAHLEAKAMDPGQSSMGEESPQSSFSEEESTNHFIH